MIASLDRVPGSTGRAEGDRDGGEEDHAEAAQGRAEGRRKGRREDGRGTGFQADAEAPPDASHWSQVADAPIHRFTNRRRDEGARATGPLRVRAGRPLRLP